MHHYKLNDFARVELAPIELAIIVPTLNERGNIGPLLEKLIVALSGTVWEVVFVDDNSTDGTAELVERFAVSDRRVRLIRRFGRRGLASAVVEGMLSTTAPVVAVIDGDLQHDESALAGMYSAVTVEGNDLAVGTRYSIGGSTGTWSKGRRIISRFATHLSLPLLKTPVSDPMSGFFAIRRSAVLAAVPKLSSVGYKILLDLIASSPAPLKVKEIPYRFRNRTSGESKLGAAVALEYVELLLDKTIGRLISPKFVIFGAVGAVGVLVHLSALGAALVLTEHFAAAQAFAVLTAMTFNFALNNMLTYRDQRRTGWAALTGLFGFYAVCSIGAAANVGVGSFLYAADQKWWLSGVAGALVGSIWNFAASRWLTWTRR